MLYISSGHLNVNLTFDPNDSYTLPGSCLVHIFCFVTLWLTKLCMQNHHTDLDVDLYLLIEHKYSDYVIKMNS